MKTWKKEQNQTLVLTAWVLFMVCVVMGFIVMLLLFTSCKKEDIGFENVVEGIEDQGEVITHLDYEFVYCEEFEQSYYVRYVINIEDVFGPGNREYSKWLNDEDVLTGSAYDYDYKGSGYDRGHLKPAAVSKTSQEHMNHSHFFTNASPQKPGFNRVGWRLIEEEVRHIVGDKKQDSLIVYTGPVLNDVTEFIGKNKVGVPKYFYKAILFGDSTKAYAYLCPNEKLSKPYSQYIVSVDKVEALIGIDLFPGLSESLED